MNHIKRQAIIASLFTDCLDECDRKGQDYAVHNGTEKEIDSLSNFKSIASMLGSNITKYTVWYVYFAKHIHAITTFITTGKLESEGIKGRIIDAINYLAILHCMLEEDQEEEKHEQRY